MPHRYCAIMVWLSEHITVNILNTRSFFYINTFNEEYLYTHMHKCTPDLITSEITAKKKSVNSNLGSSPSPSCLKAIFFSTAKRQKFKVRFSFVGY